MCGLITYLCIYLPGGLFRGGFRCVQNLLSRRNKKSMSTHHHACMPVAVQDGCYHHRHTDLDNVKELCPKTHQEFYVDRSPMRDRRRLTCSAVLLWRCGFSWTKRLCVGGGCQLCQRTKNVQIISKLYLVRIIHPIATTVLRRVDFHCQRLIIRYMYVCTYG